MEPDHPPWLDEEFLATVLQGGEDKEPRVKVLNFTARLAVAAGNNYLSRIFRVRVEYQQGDADVQTTSLMLKAPMTKGIVADMSERMDVFGKEIRVYSELLPKINEKLNLELGPKYFYCPVKALVLSDLKEEGYIMVDKAKQLDFSHCEKALTKLAKFHAASVACFGEDPELIKSIGQESMFIEGEEFENQFKPWMQIGTKNVTGLVADNDQCKPAVEFINEKIDTLPESILQLIKPKPNGLNVLNHGDFWMNNMMFKHNDSGEVVDVKIIDFQVTRYASPVLDVVYFLWVSANEDVRESRLKELFFDVYLETLNSTLDELGCKERMSQEEFREDLKRAVDFAIVAITNTLPMAICEADNAVDMEDFSEEDMVNFKDDKPDERFMKIYQGKTLNALLPNILKHFHTWATSLQ